MGNPMKIRAAAKDGITEVKVLMSHEMETGFRKDASGNPIPAWFITEVSARLDGRDVMKAQWGPSISKNPFLSFKIKGGKAGDRIAITWVDNKGDSRTDEAAIT
ncbi:MAG: thiosulfate oxidation carrier complex protein SoxZ [Siculibacillus sp.]